MPPRPAPNLTLDIAERARSHPDDPALIRGDEVCSYARLDAAVWRVARRMRDAGVRAGETVALTFRDEPTLGVAMLAVARLGATVIVIPQSATPTQRTQWSASGDVRHRASDQPARFGLEASAIVVDPVDFSQAPSPADESLLDPVPRAPLILTIGSGSTGRRKLMPVAHSTVRARLRNSNEFFGIRRDDRGTTLAWLEFGSAFHRFLGVLVAGGAHVFFDRARDEAVEALRRQAVTAVTATVSQVERMLASLPPGTSVALPSLRSLAVSSSTVSSELRARIRRALTPNLYVLYGSNETHGICSLAPGTTPDVRGSVGRPFRSVELQVVDARLVPVPPGHVGQVRVRGPGVIQGYLDDPQASAKAFVDGWFMPGDLGLLTPDGQLVHHGRIDDMMIVDGVNLYPAEIEQVLREHPGVVDAAALALPDPVHHHVPVAVVALDPAARIDGRALFDWVAGRLGARGPRYLVELERIPRNEQGKLLRAELTERIRASLAADGRSPPGA